MLFHWWTTAASTVALLLAKGVDTQTPIPVTQTFNFSFNSWDCDGPTFSFTKGGTAPFYIDLWLLGSSSSGTPYQYTVPAQAVVDGASALFLWPLHVDGAKAIFIMSDSTGWGTGGSTDLGNYGPSGCNTSASPPASTWEFGDAITMSCANMIVRWNQSLITPPVQLHFLVPQGNAWTINSLPGGEVGFTLPAPYGTAILLGARDSKNYGSGIREMIAEGGSTCTTSSSSSSPPPSSSIGPVHTSGPNPNPVPNGTGKIVGIVVGMVAVAIPIGLALGFWLRKRRIRKREHARQQPVDLFENGGPGDVASGERGSVAERAYAEAAGISPFMGGLFELRNTAPNDADVEHDEKHGLPPGAAPGAIVHLEPVTSAASASGSSSAIPATDSSIDKRAPVAGQRSSTSSAAGATLGSETGGTNATATTTTDASKPEHAPTTASGPSSSRAAAAIPGWRSTRPTALLDAIEPSQAAPARGFRMHEDGGLLKRADEEEEEEDEEDIEELPPNYDPAWQQRRRSGRSRQGSGRTGGA